MDVRNPGLANIIAITVFILSIVFIFVKTPLVATFVLIAIALLALAVLLK